MARNSAKNNNNAGSQRPHGMRVAQPEPWAAGQLQGHGDSTTRSSVAHVTQTVPW
jgi:hypothetical protein